MEKQLESMRKISPETLHKLFQKPHKCQVCGATERKLDYHHNLIYQGRQVDSPNTILIACRKCHDKANEIEMREKMDRIMLNQMTEDELERYSKVENLQAKKQYLNEKIQ